MTNLTDDEILAKAYGEGALRRADGWHFTEKELKAFARAIAAAEREACARLCEEMKERWVDGSDQWGRPCLARITPTTEDCAAAIRARSET